MLLNKCATKYKASFTEFAKKKIIEKAMKRKTIILLKVFTTLLGNREAYFNLLRFV